MCWHPCSAMSVFHDTRSNRLVRGVTKAKPHPPPHASCGRGWCKDETFALLLLTADSRRPLVGNTLFDGEQPQSHMLVAATC